MSIGVIGITVPLHDPILAQLKMLDRWPHIYVKIALAWTTCLQVSQVVVASQSPRFRNVVWFPPRMVRYMMIKHLRHGLLSRKDSVPE